MYLEEKMTGQVTGCLVIASDNKSLAKEVTGDGTHSDAPCSYEVYSLDIFILHCLLI